MLLSNAQQHVRIMTSILLRNLFANRQGCDCFISAYADTPPGGTCESGQRARQESRLVRVRVGLELDKESVAAGPAADEWGVTPCRPRLQPFAAGAASAGLRSVQRRVSHARTGSS
jgi:hypothetical protein